MQKIVINDCFGGFGLSDEAIEWLIKNKGWKVTIATKEGKTPENEKDEKEFPITDFQIYNKEKVFSIMGRYYINDTRSDEFRKNPDLIEVIETLGKKANEKYASLKIVEIPDGVKWTVKEYDGNEWIAEKHRTWGY